MLDLMNFPVIFTLSNCFSSTHDERGLIFLFFFFEGTCFSAHIFTLSNWFFIANFWPCLIFLFFFFEVHASLLIFFRSLLFFRSVSVLQSIQEASAKRTMVLLSMCVCPVCVMSLSLFASFYKMELCNYCIALYFLLINLVSTLLCIIKKFNIAHFYV